MAWNVSLRLLLRLVNCLALQSFNGYGQSTREIFAEWSFNMLGPARLFDVKWHSYQTLYADTLSQGAVIERKSRHMLETIWALLFQIIVPKPFWFEAISIACFLINYMLSSVLHGEIPCNIIFSTKPFFPIQPWILGSIFFGHVVYP